MREVYILDISKCVLGRVAHFRSERLDSDDSHPVDYWGWLESLTFHRMEIRSTSSIGDFERWLRKRDLMLRIFASPP